MSIPLCEFCDKEAIYVDAKKEIPFCDQKSCYEKSKQKSLRNPLNLKQLILQNTAFRKIVHTEMMQIIVMSIEVGKGIGDFNNTQAECHSNTLQFIMVFQGEAEITRYYDESKKCKRDESKTAVVVHLAAGKEDSLVIEPNTYHFVKNEGKVPLQLLTVYSSPQH